MAARRLARIRRAVARVCYPGLSRNRTRDHAIARRQMTRFWRDGVLRLAVATIAALPMLDRLQRHQRAASLGWHRKHLQPAGADVAILRMTDDQLAAAGVTRGMIRLSVGLEHVDDLIADFEYGAGVNSSGFVFGVLPNPPGTSLATPVAAFLSDVGSAKNSSARFADPAGDPEPESSPYFARN